MAKPPFELFGTAHVVTLLLTLAVGGGMLWGARRHTHDHKVLRWVAEGLAWMLLLSHPAKLLAYRMSGEPLADSLWPLHLCNCAAVLAFIALRFRHPLCAELVFFWGLAATLQALITPNVPYDFPHPIFLVFFLSHSGIVIAAVYLVFGMKLHPRPGSVWRVWGCLQLYVLVAAVVNWLTDSNYGFLCAKPANGSLFDHLGEWPYYIVFLELISLTAFAILYGPFFMRQRVGAESRE